MMGLYLAVFDGDEELAGVEVGSYADFSSFRSTVSSQLENGHVGAKYPTLMLHSDCDGLWSPREAATLIVELEEIGAKFRLLPPIQFNQSWQLGIIKLLGLKINNLYDCFFDIDGEPLIERIIDLAKLSVDRQLPIFFQ